MRAEDRRTTVCVAAGALHYGFPGDPRTALDEFEVLSGEEVSESLKVALVQKGITDDALKTHLVLHASRLSTFQTCAF